MNKLFFAFFLAALFNLSSAFSIPPLPDAKGQGASNGKFADGLKIKVKLQFAKDAFRTIGKKIWPVYTYPVALNYRQ